MKYFKVDANTTVDSLHSTYRALAFKLHPDKGGSHSEFLNLTAEYEKALRLVQVGSVNSREREKAHNLLKDIHNYILNNPDAIYNLIELMRDKKKLDHVLDSFFNETMDSLKHIGIKNLGNILKKQ